MMAMIDCIRNGTTTIFDHHSSPGAVTGSLFRIAEAAHQTGLRSCLCYEVTDREGEGVTALSIDENRAFLQYCRQSGDSLLRGLFGLHASFTVSDKTIARCTDAAAGLNTGFHIHVAEAASDQAQCQLEHGARVVHRLHDLGVLGGRTSPPTASMSIPARSICCRQPVPTLFTTLNPTWAMQWAALQCWTWPVAGCASGWGAMATPPTCSSR